MAKSRFTLWFKEVGVDDLQRVGGKNASLGEMYRNLSSEGVKIPNGFAVTASAYFHLLESADLNVAIRKILKGLNSKNVRDLGQRGRRVRELIENVPLTADLEAEIIEQYRLLEKEYGDNVDVAVRSSATAEDLPEASFAGQQETYLNVRGSEELLRACRRCFASLFTDRAISYRDDKGFDHFSIGLSVGVQKMVRSDRSCSGVMFSIDTETGFSNAVIINGSWGLGESIVGGKVIPDEFCVFKPTLAQGYGAILSKKLGAKDTKITYSTGLNPTKTVATTAQERRSFVLDDEEILQLARWALTIEEHYSRRAGCLCPMDMEWAKDGVSGELYIVQARPETVQSLKNNSVLTEYRLCENGKLLLTGAPVGGKIGQGRANVILDVQDIAKFKVNQVLVTRMTDPDWEPIMKMAAAIVTDRGGRTCHAAIISRELGIPCVVGAEVATKKIESGQSVTVSCAEGETGKVYQGLLKFEVKETDIADLERPRTKIMMNLGNPELAFSLSSIPNDGVGLAREEFVISSYIKIHPLALVHFDRLKDQEAKREIERLTAGYESKEQFFVDRLAQGIAIIGAAFYPRDVIVRLSDFKSNEYANLIGGAEFEPQEANPMLGWRGASRYYDENFRSAFGLECRALKKVREQMGLLNVKVMVPFCRTVLEGRKVEAEMARHGLVRGENGLEIYVMCEIPSNVILADEFAEIFDGFSIGSNDLTQLALGIDRDSELVAHIYDERNEAVKRLISQVIKAAKKRGRKIGICGQAPSDFPDFAEFLVTEGIDSISLNPDTVIKTTLKILEAERKLSREKSSRKRRVRKQ
ncbi:MAG: phosphoenolpyruvate synthase [Candidatus Zixiibacteriota bacterium]